MQGKERGGALFGRRVLVVEDTFVVADVLGRVLAERGCRILGPASSVEQALALLGSKPPGSRALLRGGPLWMAGDDAHARPGAATRGGAARPYRCGS